MKPTIRVYSVFFILFLTGCGISLPDFSSEKELVINDSDYNKVLDSSYNGYEDDDDLDGSDIRKGAEKFAQCANATECGLLWDTAKKWITEKSTYNGTLKTNTRDVLETKANPTRSLANKITFKVTRSPNGGKNIIKIVADCPKNCVGYIHKEYFAFNSYLKNHLLAYKNDIVGYEKLESDIFISASGSDKLDIDFDDFSGNNQRSVLVENDMLNKIEITKRIS